ncbi:MAG: hypothetical protein ABR587_07195 [Candidatus Binatia bacterium]
MAVKPVDRIRTMITDLERGARTLGDDIRKRAGNVTVTSDLEAALRQLMQGLTTIAAQLEKAAGELRRYLEKGSKGKRSRKAGGKKAAKKTSRKKSTKKAAAKKAAPAKAASKKVAKANGKKGAAKR